MVTLEYDPQLEISELILYLEKHREARSLLERAWVVI